MMYTKKGRPMVTYQVEYASYSALYLAYSRGSLLVGATEGKEKVLNHCFHLGGP